MQKKQRFYLILKIIFVVFINIVYFHSKFENPHKNSKDSPNIFVFLCFFPGLSRLIRISTVQIHIMFKYLLHSVFVDRLLIFPINNLYMLIEYQIAIINISHITFYVWIKFSYNRTLPHSLILFNAKNYV